MKLRIGAMLVAGLLLAGCSDSSKPGPAGGGATAGGPAGPGGAPPMSPGMPPGGGPGMGPGGAGGPPAGGAVETTDSAEPTPVAVEAGVAALGAENSKIEFIGTHVGARPDPRLGGFEKISGKAEVDEATKTLKSISIDIDTRSVWTQIGGPLTNHLKSADFFDANEFPDAKFQSTEVEATDAAAGQFTVTGDLTLHGVTKPITAPATIKIDDGGLTLISQFSIDRTEFGMTGVQDRVEKSVALTFVIGDKTQPKSGGFGFGGPGGPPGGAKSP